MTTSKAGDLSAGALLQAAREITAAAASTPLRYFRASFSVEQKADESPVTVADRETEAALRKAIVERYPGHGILGAEFGGEHLERDIVWVAGIIRMPALNECYAGAAETGSDRDGTPIACRKDVPLDRAFLCVNEADRLMADHPAAFERLMATGRYRRFTYDCYPYAQLASGQVDAVIDLNLKPYDYLPVAPVVEGAGGVITDWQGRPLTLQSDGRVVAAASAEIHSALLEILSG
jgi:fructose-1,6-bisphosphatase/inositol monophosphatase family enzyme